jgi:hypothetical protein
VDHRKNVLRLRIARSRKLAQRYNRAASRSEVATCEIGESRSPGSVNDPSAHRQADAAASGSEQNREAQSSEKATGHAVTLAANATTADALRNCRPPNLLPRHPRRTRQRW